MLIVGYGSIGKRHSEVLQQYFNAHITLISSQNLPNAYPTFESLPDIAAFDYYIIASPTAKHFQDLKYIDSLCENKIIFVEKPLFESNLYFAPSGKNTIVIGFCLRFHPILWLMRQALEKETPYFVEISCGSYLPLWRENTDYRHTYSAHKKRGGGVLLDLSHELDYTQWLFGDFIYESIKGFNGKISELEISSDDILTFVAHTAQGAIINLTCNYFSKIPRRTIRAHTTNATYECDLIQNIFSTFTKQGVQNTQSISFARNELFAIMHQSVLHSPSFTSHTIPKDLLAVLQAGSKGILPTLDSSLMQTLTRIKNMKLTQNILCVIGARGGSKGVKNKNIMPIAGKPLLAHTIIQALQSRLFSHIVLSTDSEDIAKVGEEYGAEVFFLRDKALATDDSGKLPAIRDALLRSEAHYKTHFDVIFDLDATSPLRLVSDITQAYEQFLHDDNDILITASPARKSPYFNLIEIFEEEGEKRVNLSKKPPKPILRRQDSPKCYDMNASIYIWKREALLENDSVFTPNTGLFIMPEERSIDIDTPLDFAFVDFMLNHANKQQISGGGGNTLILKPFTFPFIPNYPLNSLIYLSPISYMGVA